MKAAKVRYNSQKQTAKQRKIEFNLSFEEWYNWWLDNGIDRNYAQPFNKDTLCMCRYNDIGPYSLDNIYCDTLSSNMTTSNKLKSKDIKSRNSKPVSTPDGIFSSKINAANYYRIKPQSFSYWMKKQPLKYYYV